MAGAQIAGRRLLLLRCRRSSAAAASPPFFSITQHFSHSASAARDTESEDGVKGRENWYALPPFSAAVDASSLGKKLASGGAGGGGDSVGPANMTALKWVLRCCPQLPRSLLHKLFRLRQVRRECLGEEASKRYSQARWCQLKRVAGNYIMNQGERIVLPKTVNELAMEKPDIHCTDEEVSLIRSLEVHKDSAIIALNKPPGLPVQGGLGIRRSLDKLAAPCLTYDYSEPPRLVHRLDKDSSGILVMGRTQVSTAILHSIFREKTLGASDNANYSGKRLLKRRYLALVLGAPRLSKGSISVPLAKVMVDNGNSERITIGDNDASSQHAVTDYRVIESFDGFSLLELTPLTGRKHQLRIHCAEVLRTPIVGDYKYGLRAHKKWKPLSHLQSMADDQPEETYGLFLDLARGSIAEKRPFLHLHCKQMILPDIYLALKESLLDPDFDVSHLESLNLVAPLPFHMQQSWDILNSTPRG